MADISDEELLARIGANMVAQGKPKPSSLEDWTIIRHPTTGEPIAYLDPVTGDRVTIPAAPTQTVEKPATPLAQLQRLDKDFQLITDPKQAAVWIRDPATNSQFKLEADEGLGDPGKWTTHEFAGATVVVDPSRNNKIVATVPAKADAAAKRTGAYEDMVDPNDPTKKRVIAKVDTGSKEIFSVSQQANKQVVTTPNKVFVFNDDGSVANTLDITPDKPPVVVPIGNKAFVFNPKDGTWAEGPSVDEPATVGVSTQNEFYVFFDKNGKEVSRVKNPSYQAPQTTQGTQSATAPFVQQWNQKTGQWEWVENKGRVTIGEATQNMIKELTGQTVDPAHPMSLEEANSLLTTAINKMNADAQQATTAAGAAQNILSGQQQGAQTGAGMLNQRAATAQNLVQQGLTLAQSTGGRYGNYSGGILNPMPGFGQALTQGAAGYATELGGGQEVFDTAVRMVQAADPNGSNPDRAAAVGLLTQLMDRYKQTTGQDHPTVAATRALAQSNANGGLAAPATVAPQPWQRADQMFGGAPAGSALAPVGVAGAVAPGSPMYLGTIPVAQAQPRSAAELGFTAPGGAMRFM